MTSFTNDIGQILDPGDRVIIVSSGYSHQVSCREGTFLGLHKNGGAQCEYVVKSSRPVLKSTGEKPSDDYYKQMHALHYTSQEYKAMREQIEYVPYEYKRRTTLQLNRVYKLAE